jgi:hypothetical protein
VFFLAYVVCPASFSAHVRFLAAVIAGIMTKAGYCSVLSGMKGFYTKLSRVYTNIQTADNSV